MKRDQENQVEKIFVMVHEMSNKLLPVYVDNFFSTFLFIVKQETSVHDIINVFKIESFTVITCSYKFKSEDWPKKLVHLGEFCFLCPLGGIHY